MRNWWIVLATACALAAAPRVEAGPVVAGFDANTLVPNDDESEGPVDIGFTVNFFGVSYSSLYVNNNGNVTFDGPLFAFTPEPLVGLGLAIIAPFWADVDTRGAGDVSYGSGTFAGRPAFGVTWSEVGYFFENTDKLNTFQLLLVDRSDVGIDDFDIVFNYDVLQWETGDASDGIGGLGGFSARAGYTNGSLSYELDGSAVNGALLDGGSDSLAANSNVGVAGRWVFEARNGQAIPEAGSFAFAGFAAAGAGLIAAARRRR